MAVVHRGWVSAALASFVALATVCLPATAQQVNVSYSRNMTLDDNFDFYWTIDTELATIRVAVHAKAATGWAGFGFSEMGGMEGADIIYYEALSGNLTDAHALEIGTPIADECSQDWTLLSAEVGDTGLVFEAERSLETSDTQDRSLVDDSVEGTNPTRLIAAWGSQDSVSYHGSNVGQAQVILFEEDNEASTDLLVDIKAADDISYFDIAAQNYTIPAEKTEYEFFCVPASELPVEGEFHVVGIEALLYDGTEEFIHHLVVKGYTDSDDCHGNCSREFFTAADTGIEDGDCDGFVFDDIYAWAPGVAALAMPDDVGFRFGSSGYRSIGIQMHYNNPDFEEGVTDNSGARVYYSEELRSIDAGLLQIGDPFLSLADSALSELPDNKSLYSFSCPSSCFEEFFEDENVTVFGHFLHMHATGQHMITRQYRDDILIKTSRVEYYSFDQGGGYNTYANGSETIQKGDRFETHCYYDTAFAEIPGQTVSFGPGSEDEMCIDFVYYYPAQPIPFGMCGIGTCNGSLDNIVALDDDSTLNRTFGIVDTCAEALAEETTAEDEDASSSGRQLPGLTVMAYTAATSLLLLLL
ncbi:unnamed protein product [Sphacelaria rigidula]